MEVIIKELWHVLLAVFAAVVFVIRQEGRTNQHDRELARLQKQRDDDLKAAQKSREETHQMLHDIAAKLDRLIERMLPKG